MFWQLAWITVPMLLGTAVSFVIALSAYRRTDVAGNRAYTAFMVVLGIWMGAYTLELSLTDEAPKLFFAQLQYLGIPFTTPLMWWFAYHAAGFSRLAKRPIYIASLIIPMITATVIWVRRSLIWSEINCVVNGVVETGANGCAVYDAPYQFDFEYGGWFLVNWGYSYLLFMLGFGLMVWMALRSPRLSRLQGALLLTGALVPFISNLSYVAGFNPFEIDTTPGSLAIFAIATAFAFFEFRLLDIMPFVSNAAFKALPDCAFTVDDRDLVQQANGSAEYFFAMSRSALTGKHISQLLPKEWLEVLDSAEIDTTLNTEVHRKEQDGVFYFDLRSVPIFDRRDRYQGRLIMIRDITLRKRAQLELAQREQILAERVAERTMELRTSNEELLRAVRLKDEFLAGMSHELRTPLNAVLGTSEALREEVYGEMSLKQKRSLQRIEDSAEHLLSLITDILDVSKIEAGQFTLRLAQASVEELCRSCTNLVRQEAQSKGIQLISSVNVEQTTMMVDPRRVRQILLNLLTNAIKFTPDDGKVALAAFDRPEHRETLFVVQDNGIGISAEHQEQIFEPFMQVDSALSRRYEGTGLGLALTQRLVQMHGGRIEVRSELQKGSRFMVYLPWDCRGITTYKYELELPVEDEVEEFEPELMPML